MTYTNRSAIYNTAQEQKPAPMQKSVPMQKPAPMKIVRNTHSMAAIIRTPGNSCSSCGH